MNSTTNVEDNDVNGTRTASEGASSGRCPVEQQRGSGHHPDTAARVKWTKIVNVAVMECYYRSKPFDEEGKPVRGYRKRMYRYWQKA